MSTHDLEQRVSAALGELVRDPVGSPSMFDRVAVLARRRHRRRLTGLAAIVVVVAGAATGGLMLGKGGEDRASVVASAAPCPDKDSGSPAKARRSDLAGRLVPGKPVIATVCRYYGLNQSVAPATTLARSVVIRDAGVTALAATLNTGKPVPRGPINCPGFAGGSIRVIFEYRVGEAVTVRISLGDCQFASNGTRSVTTSAPTRQQLTDLVGKDPT